MTTTASAPAATNSTPAAPAADSGGGAGGSPFGHLTDKSSVDDVMAALGAPGDGDGPGFDLDDAEGEAPASGAGGEAAAAKSNGDGASAGASPDAPAGDEDGDIKAVLARSAARRRARAAAARTTQTPAAAPAAPATSAAQPPAANGAAQPAAASAPAGVTAAVQDILAQIAKLAGDDEDAASAAAGAPDTTQAARDAALDAIRKKVEAIGDGLKGNEETRAVVEKLQAKLKDFEDERFVNDLIEKKIDASAAALPLVSSGDRFEVEIGGKKVRGTGAQLVKLSVERYWKKHGSAPSLTAVARVVEKRLVAAQQPARSDTREAPPTRKTISSSHGAPPSARSGPDKRTKEEIERDLYAKFGVEPDEDNPFA